MRFRFGDNATRSIVGFRGDFNAFATTGVGSVFSRHAFDPFFGAKFPNLFGNLFAGRFLSHIIFSIYNIMVKPFLCNLFNPFVHRHIATTDN